MLELRNISYSIPEKDGILKNISMSIQDGETVVITGPNGGGKTTLAKAIAGVVQSSSGEILLDNEDISAMDITERAHAGIAYAFQQPVRFKGMTTRELIRLSSNQDLSENQLCDVLSTVGLCTRDYLGRDVDAKLSGGEIKRIEIATVMLRDAKVYIFDEPEAGIDLWSFNNLIEVFKNLKQTNRGSILIISHQERILDIADKIAVIADGELTQFGPKDEILPVLSIHPHSFRCLA